MTDSISKVIKKISRMRVHHSEDDIRAAMRQILEGGFPDRNRDVNTGRHRGSGGSKRGKPLSDGVSRAVLELEGSDPDKFKMLSSFDRLLRKGDVLKDMRSLREFGQSIDKSFEPGKARKEAVPRLVQLLADMPMDRLATVVESALDKERRRADTDDDYQALANFLMAKRSK
ncbi:hypothetical protein [Salinisphaera sp. PC39]|uniref:hypothetical protein n=1 Tax=Salinisphaera sp. PC39 TaxID=1304156 RepID=UPI00333E3F01